MKIIEIIVDHGHIDTLVGIAEQYEVPDYWLSMAPEEERESIRMLVSDDKRLDFIVGFINHGVINLGAVLYAS